MKLLVINYEAFLDLIFTIVWVETSFEIFFAKNIIQKLFLRLEIESKNEIDHVVFHNQKVFHLKSRRQRYYIIYSSKFEFCSEEYIFSSCVENIQLVNKIFQFYAHTIRNLEITIQLESNSCCKYYFINKMFHINQKTNI